MQAHGSLKWPGKFHFFFSIEIFRVVNPIALMVFTKFSNGCNKKFAIFSAVKSKKLSREKLHEIGRCSKSG